MRTEVHYLHWNDGLFELIMCRVGENAFARTAELLPWDLEPFPRLFQSKTATLNSRGPNIKHKEKRSTRYGPFPAGEIP